MEPLQIGILFILLFLILLFLGVHIGVSFLFVGFLGSALIIGFKPSFNLLGQTLYYSVANYSYCALPLFVLMGAFAARGGFAEKAYNGLHVLTRKLPGSLAIATCFGCAAFGAVSGSSMATAVIFGKLALPEMEKYGYDKKFSLGSIAAAGTFAAMIPPSAVFIVYAIFTEQSIGKLFMAGIIPGIITAIVYSISIIIRVKTNPKLVSSSIKEYQEVQKIAQDSILVKINALISMWPIFLLAFIVLGGIYGGIFSAIEASAAGALATLVLGILHRRITSFKIVKEALRESARTTSMIFIIIAGALFFTRFLAISRIPITLSRMLLGLDIPSIFILLLVIIDWFILGMLIIPTGIFALTLPIVFPILTSLGYDPIWIGVIALKLVEIGAVTPPVGLNVYALKGVAGKNMSLEDIFKGIWPFVICDLVVLVILIIFPQIVLFLPNLMWK
jgi:C4-dicarboxylate transporter, DctM subunit